MVGIVRSVEEYGTFVEIAPNLAGLAETCPDLHPGQAVSVYIKNILPDKMKISWSSSTTAWARATGSTCSYFHHRGAYRPLAVFHPRKPQAH